jgi:hypothetical protein
VVEHVFAITQIPELHQRHPDFGVLVCTKVDVMAGIDEDRWVVTCEYEKRQPDVAPTTNH